MTPPGPGIPPHLAKSTETGSDWYIPPPPTHTQSAGQTGLSLQRKRKGLAFVFWFASFLSPPLFVTAKPAVGVEHGEGGREENLVNSWGPSLFIAGLGEMWLTE